MPIVFKTKNMAVYEALRRDIIHGRLKPGQKIVMSEVSREFGLSEIPIREAIRRLESEGFINFTPHVGAVVSRMDEREFIEIYLIRIELEALATRLAVLNMNEKDFEFLAGKNEEMKAAIEQNHPEKLGSLNKDFHLRIYRAASYPFLLKLISNLWEKVERTQSVFAYVPERASASVHEHREMIDALRARDAKLAEKLVREQKSRTMEALERYLRGTSSEGAAGSILQ